MTPDDIVTLAQRLAPIIASVAAAFFASRAYTVVQTLNIQINGRMDALLTLTAKSSHAEGKAEGVRQVLSENVARAKGVIEGKKDGEQ